MLKLLQYYNYIIIVMQIKLMLLLLLLLLLLIQMDMGLPHAIPKITVKGLPLGNLGHLRIKELYFQVLTAFFASWRNGKSVTKHCKS